MAQVLGLIDLSYLLRELKKRELKLNLPSLRDFLTYTKEARYGLAFFVYVPSYFKDLNYLRINGFQMIPAIHKSFRGIDKHIGLQLCMDALQVIKLSTIDIVVLVSGDADFALLLELLRQRGINVELASFPEVSMTLKQAANKFIDLNVWAKNINNVHTIAPQQPVRAKPVHSYGEISIPSFVFYKKKDFWIIGEEGKGQEIKDSKGLSFIHFLLDNPSESLSSEVVYNLAKEVKSEYIHQIGKGEIDYLNGSSKYEILEGKTPREIQDAIDLLKCNMEDGKYSNEQELIDMQAQKGFLEKYLREGYVKKKKATFRNPESEKARINVTKNIRRSLIEIHKKIPALKPYINTNTIRIVKYKWSYNSSDEIKWILHTSKSPS